MATHPLTLVFSVAFQTYDDDPQVYYPHLEEMTPRMVEIIRDVILPYEMKEIWIDSGDIYVTVVYPKEKMGDLLDWLDMLDVNGDGPDTWKKSRSDFRTSPMCMEGDLETEYMGERVEFVPGIIRVIIEWDT